MFAKNYMFFDDSTFAWILILGSSFASILGATVVFVDALVRRFTSNVNFSLADNKTFISSTLALSSGILFYSSQFLLIPEALEEIEESASFRNHPYFFLGLFYTSGIIFTLLLNKLVALIAPSAIACPCSHDEQTKQTICLSPEVDSFHSHDHTPIHSAHHSALDLHKHEMASCSNERSALISKSMTPVTDYGSFECLKASTIPLRNSTIISNNRFSESGSDCECKFTPNLPVSLDEVWGEIPIKDMRRFSHISCSTSAKKATVITIEEPLVLPTVKPRDVEEHNIMWSVGIQTAVAVGLHKLPEGLITVIGAGASQKLGLNLFIGIACHNFPEGFMLAIPIYAATGSALKAFTFAALIGGLTQPLGGLIGLALLDHVRHSDLATLNSVLFPLVAGIMLAVIVQSFIPAIRRQLSDSSSLPAIVCFFGGVGVMALLTSLFGHV